MARLVCSSSTFRHPRPLEPWLDKLTNKPLTCRACCGCPPAGHTPCLAELEPLQHKPTNRTTHLRGLLRMPSCWSRASGATADGCSGADMSMEARTVGQKVTQLVWGFRAEVSSITAGVG